MFFMGRPTFPNRASAYEGASAMERPSDSAAPLSRSPARSPPSQCLADGKGRGWEGEDLISESDALRDGAVKPVGTGKSSRADSGSGRGAGAAGCAAAGVFSCASSTAFDSGGDAPADSIHN